MVIRMMAPAQRAQQAQMAQQALQQRVAQQARQAAQTAAIQRQIQATRQARAQQQAQMALRQQQMRNPVTAPKPPPQMTIGPTMPQPLPMPQPQPAMPFQNPLGRVDNNPLSMGMGPPQDMSGIQMMQPVDRPQDMSGIQMFKPGGIDNGPGNDLIYPGDMSSGAMLDPNSYNNDPQYHAYGQWMSQNPTPQGTQQISFDDWKAQQGTALGSLPTTGPLSMSAKPGMMSLSMNGAAPV